MLRRSVIALDSAGARVTLIETTLRDIQETADGPIEVIGAASWSKPGGPPMRFVADGVLEDEDGNRFTLVRAKPAS